jgi:hypothetical protein
MRDAYKADDERLGHLADMRDARSFLDPTRRTTHHTHHADGTVSGPYATVAEQMRALSAPTKRAHTPGPWGIGDYDDGHECVIEASESKRMICECYEDGEEHTDEDRANARLIAAAPDLLDACKEVLRCAALPELWAAPIRAAIAKADGRP